MSADGFQIGTSGDVIGKLIDVMAEITAIGKEGRNDSQGFNFRGVDQIVDEVGPLLRKHRVLVMPSCVSVDHAPVEVGRNRTLMTQAVVRMRYTFLAEDGSWVWAEVPGEALDSGDKATTKALSQAYKYLWNQALCIPTNEPDPDSESFDRSPPEPTPDERAHEAGFSSAADRKAQHDAASALAKEVPEDERGPLRVWREQHGWPVTDLELAEFNDLIGSLLPAVPDA